jgi:hypothetical protein
MCFDVLHVRYLYYITWTYDSLVSWFDQLIFGSKKSLKIPKGQSEYRRRTDNTMAKKKKYKRTKNKGNNKITELRAILQRESQNS